MGVTLFVNEVILKNLFLLFITLIIFPFSHISLAAIEGNSNIRKHLEYITTGDCARDKDCPIASVIVLPKLYEKYGYQLIWKNSDSVNQLIAAIKDSYHDGLNPDDYHLPLIQDLQEKLTSKPDTIKQAKLDTVLTDSLIRLGYHLLMGKVDPESQDSSWNMSRILNLDSVLKMSSAIDNAQINKLVATLRPQTNLYKNMKQALQSYRKIQEEGGWPHIPTGNTLKQGMTDKRVIILRKRLAVTADMPKSNMESNLYDTAVVTGVKQFQQRHGFEVDGITGKETLAAMNVSIDARIDQLRVNLDRARWVLHDLPKTFVMVDIAGFNVRYIHDGKEYWRTRAQVGKAYRKTPVFRDHIRYIEFNPTWTIPPTILRKDILPKIKENVEYLRNENMVVLNQQGISLNPTSINWSQYHGKSFPYLIRQQPGPKNALGRVKFMFPNKYDVYLHDTPSKSGFEKTVRTFSSGCIRIQDPIKFAELLLRNNPGWDRKKFDAVLTSKKTTRVNLMEPLMVMLLYWTVEFDDQNRVIFQQDIYNRDGMVLTGLKGKFKFKKRKIIE